MPLTILVSIVLFSAATLFGIAQLIFAWASVPHNCLGLLTDGPWP